MLQDPLQQFQRAGVEPLRVIEEEADRLARRAASQQFRDRGGEEPAVGQVERAGDAGAPLRQERGERRPEGGERFGAAGSLH